MPAVPQSIERSTPSEVIDIGLEAGAQPALLAFASDEETFNGLGDFCRGRRLAARVGNGGIAGAIRYVANHPAASLLIVDLDRAPDPIGEIDALAEVCDPGTMVIALGSTNDVTLFRQLMDAGVSDYLIKPVKPALLLHAVEKAMRPVDAHGDPHSAAGLFVFMAARGGVGGSTVTVNTAWQVAGRTQKRVMLIDLDLQFGTTALALDLDPGRGLREMLENPSRIDNMFIASAATGASSNLHVLSSEEPLESTIDFDEEALQQLLGEIRKTYDYVIVEMPRALAVRMRGVLAQASAISIISDLSLGGMRDTMRLLDLLRHAAPKVRRLVVASRSGVDKKHELPRSEFERGIEEKISLVVPEDAKAVRSALVAGKAVQATAKASKVVTAIDSLCDAIMAEVQEAADRADQKKAGRSWQFWSRS